MKTRPWSPRRLIRSPFAANEIAHRLQPPQTFTVAALIYFVFITAFTCLRAGFERRLGGERRVDGALNSYGISPPVRQTRAARWPRVGSAHRRHHAVVPCMSLGPLSCGLGLYSADRLFYCPSTAFVYSASKRGAGCRSVGSFAMPMLPPFSSTRCGCFARQLAQLALSGDLSGRHPVIDRGQWDGALLSA